MQKPYHKPRPVTIYMVTLNGISVYDSTSLSHALRFIGTALRGAAPGRMMATAAEAVAIGYRITQC